MKRSWTTAPACAAACALAMCQTGFAVTANVGDSGTLSPTTLADHPELQGPQVTSLSGPYAGIVEPPPPITPIIRTDSGSLESWVTREPGGTLDFFYQFNVTEGLAPNRLILNNFGSNFSADIGVIGGSNPVTNFVRTSSGFDFTLPSTSPLDPASNTAQLEGIIFIRTDAMNFKTASASFLFATRITGSNTLYPDVGTLPTDGGGSDDGGTSNTPTPEPMGLLLLPLALGGLLLRRCGGSQT